MLDPLRWPLRRLRGRMHLRCLRLLVWTSLPEKAANNLRMTTSAFAASSSRVLESSKPPMTIRTLGKASVTVFAFSSSPLSAKCPVHHEEGDKYLFAQEPRSRNQSACCTAQRGCRPQCTRSRRCCMERSVSTVDQLCNVHTYRKIFGAMIEVIEFLNKRSSSLMSLLTRGADTLHIIDAARLLQVTSSR